MSEDIKDVVEAEIVSEQTKSHKKNTKKTSSVDSARDNWNVSKIFWGLLFIVIGALVLLSNFNVISVDWGNLWRLWPILIISCGLSILSFRNWIWRLASILLVIATMAAIVLVATSNTGFLPNSYKTYDSQIAFKDKTVTKSIVNIGAGASDINLTSRNQAEIVSAKLRSNVASLESNSVLDGTIQTTNLNMDTDNSQWFNGNFKSDFNIYLDRSTVTDATINAGASSIKIDTTLAKLNSLVVKSGASSIDIRLGKILDNSSVRIESGVSSINVKVPNSVGVRLNIDSGLTSNNLGDLSKTAEGVYESNGYSQSAKKINIVVKIGVSSFSIERY